MILINMVCLRPTYVNYNLIQSCLQSSIELWFLSWELVQPLCNLPEASYHGEMMRKLAKCCNWPSVMAVKQCSSVLTCFSAPLSPTLARLARLATSSFLGVVLGFGKVARNRIPRLEQGNKGAIRVASSHSLVPHHDSDRRNSQNLPMRPIWSDWTSSPMLGK